MTAGTPVVVVGGGIAGLAAAFRLKQAGCDVVVLERSGPELIGGRMCTVERGGFHLDVGATLLLASYRAMLRLAAEAGVAGQLRPTRDVFGVLRDGEVQHLRSGSKPAALTSRFVRGLSPVDLIKVTVDFLRTRSAFDWHDMTNTASRDFESVRDYALRRGLRPDTFEYLLAPFTSGPALAEPEQASVISAFFAFNTIIVSGGGFTSPQGVGFLPKALAAQIPVVHNAEVTSIERRGQEVVVTWDHPEDGEHIETAAAAIVAVPPPQAAALCSQFAPSLRDYFRQIEYSRAVHVAFGLDRPTVERSMLLQVPRIEHPNMVAYVLEHNQAAERVPLGTGLVMAHLRGTWSAANWELDDSKVVDYVLAETHRLGVLPELAGHTTFAEVFRVSPCTVIRRPGEYREAARVAPSLRSAPFFFAGGDYLGQSTTNSSLVSGEDAAARVLAAIR
jgi:protoporphyrinogen/coproporphyrinogen III oxidase